MEENNLKISLELYIRLEFSYLLPGPQYPHRLEYKAMRLVLRIKIVCHNAYIFKIYNRQSFKLVLHWTFNQAQFVVYVMKSKEIL